MSDSGLVFGPQKHAVKVEYCAPCNLSDDAQRAALELFANYRYVLAEVMLKPGIAGTFELQVAGETLFSKLGQERNPNPGELLDRSHRYLGEAAQSYSDG